MFIFLFVANHGISLRLRTFRNARTFLFFLQGDPGISGIPGQRGPPGLQVRQSLMHLIRDTEYADETAAKKTQ